MARRNDSWRRFEVRMGQLGRELPAQAVRDRTMALGFIGVRTCVLETPVDTGRLRGNWQVSIGVPPLALFSTIGGTTDKSGGSTISNGNGVIASAPPFSDIWIVNHVPYAAAINNGSERIRAFNMTGKAVAAMRSATRGR